MSKWSVRITIPTAWAIAGQFYDVQSPRQLAREDMATPIGLQRPWWVNVYPDGRITSALSPTREDALHRCTYTGETPDAEQVQVLLLIVKRPTTKA